MHIKRLSGSLLFLCTMVWWSSCEQEAGPGFGTPTPEPTPWPIPTDDDTPAEGGPTPSATPPLAMLSSIPLSRAPAIFDGEYPGDYAGYSVAMVGDLNGDGFDDLAVGAPLNDALQPDGGKVYVVFGSLFGPESDSLSTTMASFVGEGLGDRAGQTVAGAGDLNGDGLDDLLIGAPYNDLGGPDAGRVYVVLGRTTGWYPEMRLTHADFSFYGETGEQLGDIGTIAGGGDINGDGLDDIVLGVPYNSDSFTEAGKVCVVTGQTSGWDKKTRLRDTAFQLLGSDVEDWTGFSVAVVPDVNDDGMDDILIGAPHNSLSSTHAGRVYLFLGRPSLPVLSADVANMSNQSWVGTQEGEEAGVDVASAGDITGDGFEDFVIGAWGVVSGHGLGRFYLVEGSAEYPENPDESVAFPLSRAMATITFGRDYAGRPGLGIGDVDGNGIDEVLLGDCLADSAGAFEPTGADAGGAFLYSGRSPASWALVASGSQADFIFYGESPEDFAGFALAGRGDINGDGYMDLAVGAFGADIDARQNVGRVYLYYGGDPFEPPHVEP